MNEKSDGAVEGSSCLAIDHIAIAVRDLEAAVDYYTKILGFKLTGRRTVTGKLSGMIVADVEHSSIKLVLCQATNPESQISRLIENYGPGVAHIALAVDDIAGHVERLSDKGLNFDTDLISSPGLQQIFSARDPNSGLSFELIERHGDNGSWDDNAHELFAQLEKRGSY